MRGLELLAPARNAEIAREAILHGADAIYIGGPSHGARAAASNSINDIESITDYAHSFGAKVYVTLNTIIYDNELSEVESNIHKLYRAGVDALIVQDMSILRLDLPPIDLHASTQCDIRSIDKARFLADCGFSQLVLPRELSLSEINAYHQALGDDVVLEAFVHGALCVSYSGDCQASWAACRRSANRGECAQMCRLPYSLVDADGNVIIADKHLLSLRDLNRLADIRSLADAGVSSFKIEGRLKDAAYVKTVTAAYRQAIDRVIADAPTEYCRTSWGTSHINFTADTTKVFNRGFTSYFIEGNKPNGATMASIDTPKWIGEKVGTVTAISRKMLTARLSTAINNGDGLGFFDGEGSYTGFRANRVDNDRIYPATPVSITPGTTLYRNNDTRLNAAMAGKTATRLIEVDMTLTAHAESSGAISLMLSVSDDYGHMISTSVRIDNNAAHTPQAGARAKALAKLGDTNLTLRHLTDTVDDKLFIPLSVLTTLRRSASDKFAHVLRATYPYRYRRPERYDVVYDTALSYHDNVANRLASTFYRQHGAKVADKALETKKTIAPGTTVMTTRYCLRRELGCCLRTPQGCQLPQKLFLKNARVSYLLDFDCANCRMRLLTT